MKAGWAIAEQFAQQAFVVQLAAFTPEEPRDFRKRLEAHKSKYEPLSRDKRHNPHLLTVLADEIIMDGAKAAA